jgi:hypothetical protein
MTNRREATHALMIALDSQLEVVSALITAGSLPANAALPLVSNIEFVVSAWGGLHADIAAPLLARATALRRQIERGLA